MPGDRSDRLRVVVAGTYDEQYARNLLIVALLRRAGFDVDFVHRPLWGDKRHEIVGRPKWSLSLAALRTYVGLFWALLRIRRPDVLVVLYPGHLDIPVVATVGRLRGAPVLFDMFFSLRDTLEDRGLVKERGLVARGARFADRLACRFSTLVLADTPQDRAHFARATGVSETKFRLLWIGAPESLFHPRPDVDPEPDLVLFYGTFIPLHGIETIVEAAKLLEGEAVRIRLIGDGQERGVIERLVRELGVANIELCDPVPFEQLPREIAAASLCLGIFGTGPKAARVVPNKVFQCIAMGRPLLTADTPAIQSAFSGEVEVVPAGDPVALAKAIRGLLSNPDRLHELARAGRERFERDYSEKVLSQMLAQYVREAVPDDSEGKTGDAEDVGSAPRP